MYPEIIATIAGAAAVSTIVYCLSVQHAAILQQFEDRFKKQETDGIRILAGISDLRGHIHDEVGTVAAAILAKVESEVLGGREEVRNAIADVHGDVLAKFGEIQKSHVAAIVTNVKAEVSRKLAQTSAETCDICHSLVAKFEQVGEKIVCQNCKGK